MPVYFLQEQGINLKNLAWLVPLPVISGGIAVFISGFVFDVLIYFVKSLVFTGIFSFIAQILSEKNMDHQLGLLTLVDNSVVLLVRS